MRSGIFFKRLFDAKNLVILVLFLALAGSAYYFYRQNQKNLERLNNPDQAIEEETSSLIKSIGAFMDLPSDEKPTLISVTDKEKVRDQPFFSKAENGDKVLVYAAAKKAILYRPSANKVIEVGPVDIAPEATFKVALYNTTGDENIMKNTEKTLKDKVSNLSFPIKKDISYSSNATLIVDLTGDKKTEADQLAKLLGGEVSTELPSEMTKPDADFAIIISN